MSELSEAINEMRTMREIYDQIGAAAEAYNTGKVQLAENINAKGVQASATETLPELAEKVAAIAQQSIILSPSEVGDMYAKQLFGSLTEPKYWNLYEVLNSLLNDGRLLNYGGILLAEYYKGYDSLALSGAGAGGAYVVSDMENGQFKMYTSDTTHTWATEDDGKGNRWVAYCFADEGHDFEIADTNTSPRSIYIGRNVGTVRLNTNSRISQIVVTDGSSLKDIQSNTFSHNFGRDVIIRNLKEHSSGVLIPAGNVESAYIHIKKLTGGVIINGSSNILNTIIANIEESADVESSALLSFGVGTSSSLANLVVKGSGVFRIIPDAYSQNSVHLKTLALVDVEDLVLYYTSNYAYSDCTTTILYKDNDKTKTIRLAYSFKNGWRSMTDLYIKDGWCKPLDISVCISLTEANIYAHILQRLKQDEPDCGVGVTITLGGTNLAKLTSEESQDLLALLRGTYGYTFA